MRTHTGWLVVVTAGCLAAAGAGCGGKDAAPPATPEAPGALIYQPPSFCFTDGQTTKTLTVANVGDTVLVWTPLSVPAGSAGLENPLSLEPGTAADLDWTWDPPGPYPVRDSLVAETNDPLRHRVVVLARRDDPSGTPDTQAPDAPILFAPAEGDTFVLGPATGGGHEVPILMAWSELDDCSGIARYRVEIATSPGFGTSRVFFADTTATTLTVLAEDGDEGTAYWRVTATDMQGFQGPSSDVRSWTVLPAP